MDVRLILLRSSLDKRSAISVGVNTAVSIFCAESNGPCLDNNSPNALLDKSDVMGRDDARDDVSVKKNWRSRKLSCTPRVWGRWRKYRWDKGQEHSIAISGTILEEK